MTEPSPDIVQQKADLGIYLLSLVFMSTQAEPAKSVQSESQYPQGRLGCSSLLPLRSSLPASLWSKVASDEEPKEQNRERCEVKHVKPNGKGFAGGIDT